MKPRHHGLAWTIMGLIYFLLFGIAAGALAVCDYEPDGVDCSGCFVDVGQWDPSGGFIQDIAKQTLGNVVSCTCKEPDPLCNWDTDPADPNDNFADSGKPYYQMVLGCDEPFTAFSMAVLLNSGAGGFEGRGAWCTEAVSYWHKHAHIPYPNGYYSDGYHDWLVPNANELTLWYFTEQTWGAGRGRRLPSSALDELPRPLKLGDLNLGVNVPAPGSYAAIRGYEITATSSGEVIGSWKDWQDTGHSQMIDEMWIHHDSSGYVCSIEATLLEGNSGSPPHVRNDRKYENILELTPLGGDMFSGGRKIFGFGIDLDEDGDPIYDPARLHYTVEAKICSLPPSMALSVFDLHWDSKYVQKLGKYASLLKSKGGPKVQCNSKKLKIEGIPNGSTHWNFPSSLKEEVAIVIDLLAPHPRSIRGLELRWEGGSNGNLPLGYSVQFAGRDKRFENAVLPDLKDFETYLKGTQYYPPKEYPVPVIFGTPGPAKGVRFVKLTFPKGTFAKDTVLKEVRFRYHTELPDDAPAQSEGTLHRAPDCSNAYAVPNSLSSKEDLRKIQIKGVVADTEGPVKIEIISAKAEKIFGNKNKGSVYVVTFLATDAEGASSHGSVKVTLLGK